MTEMPMESECGFRPRPSHVDGAATRRLSSSTIALLAGLLLCANRGIAQERTSENDAQFARWLKRFPQADANRDGILTQPEVDAYRRQLQKGRKGQGQRGGRKRDITAALPPDLPNVKYGPHERNVLDLWLAKCGNPAPVVVYFHGGGFVHGDKRTASPRLAKSCLESGISFAAANYRFVKTDPFPAPMHDGARVIQFLRYKAKEWNLAPTKIAAYGGSAGAGMSLWIAFHEDLADRRSDDPVARQSSRLTCAGSIGGQSSYDPNVIKAWIGGRAHEHPSFLPFYGMKSFDEIDKPEMQELFDEASAIKHLTPDDPPVYQFYGEANRPLRAHARPGQGIHHPIFGLNLKAEMDELGIECVYRHRSEGADLNSEMLAFFKKHFGMTE